MKLHTEENVDMDITHVGIRGHWIRPESEPGENCMAVQVDQYIETTFEHQYMIRNKAEENAAGLWWMRPKNSFTEDPDKDLPGISVFSTGASDAAEIKKIPGNRHYLLFPGFFVHLHF